MPAFDIIRESFPSNSFRVKQTIDRFEIQSEKTKEHFIGNISLPDKWNIGLIVGSSGTGKTTIAKELFGDSFYANQYRGQSVLDDMPNSVSVGDIQKMFNSVGFSSPPSWLKPYHVLSNGEKMRVDLAAALLSGKELIVFDEFTSVVDRQVAKISSVCTQKAVRKRNSKFIAISCHYDIEEWLMPDWVFDTNEMQMKYSARRYLQQPELEFRIIKTKEKDYIWRLFGKYHYLSSVLNKSCHLFVITHDDFPCGMCASLHLVAPRVKNAKRMHRTIIHPDYQGIGLGHRLSCFVADYHKAKGFRVFSTTTNPAFTNSRLRDKRWKLIRQGRVAPIVGECVKTTSCSRITLSWEYIGDQ
jgi:ABC-type dipeptide/oligopeptide/nickel transport system ATPase subunit